jgi:hypothetical protein
MAARGGANLTMASTNDDGWRPYIVLSREDLTLSRFFHEDWQIILERPPMPMWVCPGDGSVMTREFGLGSVRGKRHSKSVNTITRLFSSKIVKIQIIICR